MATPISAERQQVLHRLEQQTAKSRQQLRAQRQRNLNAAKKLPLAQTRLGRPLQLRHPSRNRFCEGCRRNRPTLQTPTAN